MSLFPSASSTSRRPLIGGSDARIIMGDDEAALLRLWREKRGEVEPEDLSANLIVQLGRATEDLNRAWYERNTGPEYSTQCARCLFAFFGCMKLPEAHARPSPILVDEFDPGAYESPTNCFDRFGRHFPSPLFEIHDRRKAQTSRRRKLSLGDLQEGAASSALSRTYFINIFC
jgi:hypothetical protein